MTNDFDELASAYLDGQVTDAEAALVENDPDLSARVSELRAVAESLGAPVSPADETLRRRQIAAALDAFDELGLTHDRRSAAAVQEVTTDAGAGAGQVVELDRRLAPAPGGKPGRAGLPRWLGLAAGLLALVGGIGFLAQLDGLTLDSSDEAEDVAADFVATTTVATEQGAAPEADELFEAESTGAADAAIAEEAIEENTVSRDVPAAAESADDAEGADSDRATTTTGGFFADPDAVEEARVTFADLPGDDELLTLASGPTLEPSLSRCAPDGTFDGEPIGSFVPVAIGSGDDRLEGEVLFGETEPTETPILLDSSCQALE